jgi:nicotinamide-nucleotide adenylyltransferase
LAIAFAALRDTQLPAPHQLLLLFSTANADKAPKPASFLQRIAMITLFAEELQHRFQSELHRDDVPIDIGLVNTPYYVDKSSAISNADPAVYAASPKHVHLMGYDTFVRFLAPKYYQSFDPPLSALNPYFDAGHEVQVLLRTENADAAAKDMEDQESYVRSLKDGSFESSGFKSEWTDRIGLLKRDTAGGISSTSAREAAEKQDWSGLESLCPAGVAAWIMDQKLYTREGESRG